MATTTPNFGWSVPTSTDLVKDGATAIETLGDAIDASLLDLKGGTSGQVLSKNSNTDMDFVWVTSDDANAIQNSIVDAKGDLISATANDTPARLALGTNGQVLKVNTATATGLEWAADSTGMTNPMTTTGDTIYSSSGSTPARLGIGSTGQVLTVTAGLPAWATPTAAAQDFTLISSSGLSTGTTTISGISGKNALMIYVDQASSTSAGAFLLRFNSDTGSNYTLFYMEQPQTSSVKSGTGTNESEINVGGAAANTNLNMIFTVQGTNATGYKPGTWSSYVPVASSNNARTGNFFYKGTSTISSVSLICQAGTFDAGTIYVYGA
jgi:hypothetical protein